MVALVVGRVHLRRCHMASFSVSSDKCGSLWPQLVWRWLDYGVESKGSLVFTLKEVWSLLQVNPQVAASSLGTSWQRDAAAMTGLERGHSTGRRCYRTWSVDAVCRAESRSRATGTKCTSQRTRQSVVPGVRTRSSTTSTRKPQRATSGEKLGLRQCTGQEQNLK